MEDMADDDVRAIRRDLNDLRDEVHAWGNKIDLIHAAVLKMAEKTYVPGSGGAGASGPTT